MSAQAAVSSKFQHILHTRHFTALVLFVFITPCLVLYFSLMDLFFCLWWCCFFIYLFKKKKKEKKKEKRPEFMSLMERLGGGCSFYLLHFHCSVVA